MSRIIHKTAAFLRQQILFKPSMIECRNISTTSPVFAEPPKKKKRIDPVLLKMRVERKINKAKREIERIERTPRTLIPILEYQLDEERMKELKERPARNIAELGVSEASFKAAHRLWAIYRSEQSDRERDSIRKVEKAQTRALEVLKELDEGLYNRTLEVDDFSLIPYVSSHMRKETPLNPEYTSPDGYIKNITKEWVK